MSTWSREEKIERALETLCQWSGKSLAYLTQEMHSVHTHNWTQDPFSRGAYSYVKVGGNSLAKKLIRPIKKTLYFAGEATCTGPTRGTVNGALDSGLRAAQQILKDYRLTNNSRPRFHQKNSQASASL